MSSGANGSGGWPGWVGTEIPMVEWGNPHGSMQVLGVVNFLYLQPVSDLVGAGGGLLSPVDMSSHTRGLSTGHATQVTLGTARSKPVTALRPALPGGSPSHPLIQPITSARPGSHQEPQPPACPYPHPNTPLTLLHPLPQLHVASSTWSQHSLLLIGHLSCSNSLPTCFLPPL